MTTAPTQATAESRDRHDKKITFTVDTEPITTREEHLTPNQVLSLAEIDPATHYLVRVEGRRQTSYQGRGDEKIRLHDGDVFVSASTGPTPTS